MDEVPGCTLLHERLLQLGVLQREFVRWMRGEGRVASCMGVKEITSELILRGGIYRKSFYPKRFRSMSGHNNNKTTTKTSSYSFSIFFNTRIPLLRAHRDAIKVFDPPRIAFKIRDKLIVPRFSLHADRHQPPRAKPTNTRMGSLINPLTGLISQEATRPRIRNHSIFPASETPP